MAGHPLTDAEFENAMKILDSDGNGKLGYDEFKSWWSTGSDRYEYEYESRTYQHPLSRAGSHFPLSQYADVSAHAYYYDVTAIRYEMLKQADEIEDDSYAEWMEAAVQHFKYFDADQSGSIDSAEFAQLYENLKGHGYPLGTVEEATATMDADGDGHVNLTEYCGWLQKLRTGK